MAVTIEIADLATENVTLLPVFLELKMFQYSRDYCLVFIFVQINTSILRT